MCIVYLYCTWRGIRFMYARFMRINRMVYVFSVILGFEAFGMVLYVSDDF